MAKKCATISSLILHNGLKYYLKEDVLFLPERVVESKKSRGERSLMKQDTIENVSHFQNYHIFFNTSKCVANYVISFEVYDGFIGQKILKL